ncbi:MAG: aspartate aminotransferase [Alteromonadaceae bacterium]|uniref:pyridoxal phosphate-dependent aminotransferase n=1 Tax=Marinobacter sp. BGYM27 TaxID=2975597 RepID=UPI000C5E8EC6|nr:aminotransferase class I/II-fold pyridoxal phosphate-dependent enzyme [Marinobacter sp. BGYM27]MAA66670.1 aspartate aminotransferase [Alteromonadaceae bacterium]MBH84834.1 aspartate aminotransferase [Alteromonadaceae bacterium]MDG5501430.1 aminotransferase class I/II-fold pyridoxal phosphate-dependent enzyme [Marinobacter sp. BGYM27]
MDINTDHRYAINLNVRGIQPSATLRINELSNQLRADGRDIIKLGLGQSPFPVPERVVEALREHAHEKDYLPVKGLKALRESISGYINRSQRMRSTWEDVLIGPGSKELLFILQLAYYGDLLIPRPSWVSYAPQARIIGRSVYWLPTHAENNWQLTAEELDIICRDDPTRPRILILNYPSNPTGCTYTEDQLLALANVARKYGLILLSDEIYGEVHFEGNHKSIARYYPEGTIISTGLSKWAGAGGWRLGTFIFPPELRPLQDAMAIIASETYTSTSAPTQHAAITAFNGGDDLDEYLRQSRRVLKVLGEYLHRRLEGMQVWTQKPEGAFYLFPDFSEYQEPLAKRDIKTSPALCQALLEDTGIAILPASDFGFAPDKLSARLAFVDFDGGDALTVASTDYADKPLDDAFVEAVCPRLKLAMDKLENWLGKL